MKTLTRLRRIIGILILLVALALLVWGLQPTVYELRQAPIPAENMQLPTPVGQFWHPAAEGGLDVG